jgi:olefin beta-lactone synthetase
VLYPFAVECAASAHPAVARAAFASHRNQRVLATELRAGARDPAADLQRSLDWARLDRIVTVPHVPVDRRHNAKVDYPSLLRILDRQARV